MESIIRGLSAYFFLLLVFRVAGRRTLTETTTFDFVLLLIISETTQAVLVSGDDSMINSALLIITLVATNIALSMLKLNFPAIEKWLDGRPFIIVENGTCLKDRMNKARVDESDVMEAAREMHGLEKMDQVKYAILERGGIITIIPKSGAS